MTRLISFCSHAIQVELPPADLGATASLTQTMNLLRDVLTCHDSSVVTIENKKQDFKQVWLSIQTLKILTHQILSPHQ